MRVVWVLSVVLLCTVDGLDDTRDHVSEAKTSDERFECLILIFESASKTLEFSVGFKAHLIETTTSLFQLSDTSLTTLAELSLRLAVL